MFRTGCSQRQVSRLGGELPGRRPRLVEPRGAPAQVVAMVAHLVAELERVVGVSMGIVRVRKVQR